MKNINPFGITDIEINGENIAIHTCETERLIEYLDALPHWDYDEVEPVMAELCERYDLDLEDYETCEDCYDAILNAHNGIYEDVPEKAITADSFGSDLPKNWQEISDFLSVWIIDHHLTTTAEKNEMWEKYWNGELTGAPAAIAE